MVEYLTMAVPKDFVDRSRFGDTAEFERVTGIRKTRRFSGSTTEMILKAIDACNFSGEEIEAVVVVTQSPDRLSPCMAMEVHNHLQLPSGVPAFDLNHSCDGWVVGLHVARKISSKTLLICADRLRYDKTPMESLIFSDSVSITVVGNSGLCRAAFYTDGSQSSKIFCGLNGEMDMDGGFVFDFVTTKVPPLIKEFNIPLASDFLVPHQANLTMNKILAMRAGFNGIQASNPGRWNLKSGRIMPTTV